MLDSLEIKNYRNLQELRIKSLGRVNLITGKNNTGKSSLLEAVAIYAANGDINFIIHLLEQRGEYSKRIEKKNEVEYNIKAFSSLFTNRQVSFDVNDAFSISTFESTLFEDKLISISYRFIKYYDEIVEEDNKDVGIPLRRKRVIIDNNLDIHDFQIGLEIKNFKGSFIISLDRERPFNYRFLRISSDINYQLVKPENITREINAILWDNIALTDKEKHVIDALKIIEIKAEKITFVEESSRERVPVIKLSNNNNIFPLKSMGDGINRILTIILALVNSENGYLLIDELENGLHYTVQKNLWKILFYLSKELNVQIFATTHSNDCISAFEKILNSPENSQLGKLIRLDLKNGKIRQVEFDAEELKIANENNIDIR